MLIEAKNSCRMQRRQHRVSLLSRLAYDSLGRILDLLRNMEFELMELRLVNASGKAEIDMSFLPRGHHSVDALLRSIQQIVGVTRVRIDELGDIAKERQSSTDEFRRG
jgi:acetolactate synthase regulatory subunit